MKGNEVFICSKRSALNMSFQSLTAVEYKPQSLCTVKGERLIGLRLNAPLSVYPVVYALPMESIKMDKGTGIVTSVPSDSPDDWATLRDLQKKPEFYKVQKEWTDFAPVSIIDTLEYR
jgi:leucyl-tRNA synthetase